MTDFLPEIESLDSDGALRESAAKIADNAEIEEQAANGSTRAQLLRNAALGGAALAGGGALLGVPAIASAQGRSKARDIDILNFALTLEFLEAEFYAQAVSAGALSGDLLDFAKIVGRHEAAHVAFLQQALGSKAVSKPSFDFKGIPNDPGRFIQTAVSLEDTGVSAYIGQAPRLAVPANVLAAARVLAVEARHASAARIFVGRIFAEEDFNRFANMKQVLAVVDSTGFITS